MNKRITIASFVIGIIALAGWIGLSLAWEILGSTVWGSTGWTLAPISFNTTAGCDLILLILGLVFREKDRWRAFTLAAGLLIGFGLSWIYSLGGFLWPLGVILLVVSLGKLRSYREVK